LRAGFIDGCVLDRKKNGELTSALLKVFLFIQTSILPHARERRGYETRTDRRHWNFPTRERRRAGDI
jgi:hypothetical protein